MRANLLKLGREHLSSLFSGHTIWHVQNVHRWLTCMSCRHIRVPILVLEGLDHVHVLAVLGVILVGNTAF